MKAAERKAIDFIHSQCLNEYLSPAEVIVLHKSIAKLLKEQDRDTRHACAEAVAAKAYEDDFGLPRINTDEAHAAIMNTKAI